MGGFLQPPVWNPPQPTTPIGADGTFLGVVGHALKFTSGGSGSGGYLGSRLAYASSSGTLSSVNPGGGFPGSSSAPIGSLIVTLPSGNATWTSLLAGNAQQLLGIYNADSSNTLTLEPGGAGTAQFSYIGALELAPQVSALLWYDATLGMWVIA